jgi:4-hydroxybenzoyl-CoA thioesterase
MTKVISHNQIVEFGDCDPARIVWFPNYFRWIDAASRNYFIQCNVPPWSETERKFGIIGTPVVDTHAQFVQSASYGDSLLIHAHIDEWKLKSFVMSYKVMRGQDLIMSCVETRVFAMHVSDPSLEQKPRIKAVLIPDFIRRLCD